MESMVAGCDICNNCPLRQIIFVETAFLVGLPCGPPAMRSGQSSDRALGQADAMLPLGPFGPFGPLGPLRVAEVRAASSL